MKPAILSFQLQIRAFSVLVLPSHVPAAFSQIIDEMPPGTSTSFLQTTDSRAGLRSL